eukprot:m.178274 g.178274  ORF g.178274 m.178274 type:complete len:317 (+) comp17979_c2_seq3:1525-2475(+)
MLLARVQTMVGTAGVSASGCGLARAIMSARTAGHCSGALAAAALVVPSQGGRVRRHQTSSALPWAERCHTQLRPRRGHRPYPCASLPAVHFAVARCVPGIPGNTRDKSTSNNPLAAEDAHANQPLSERLLRALGWMGGFYSRKNVLTRSARKLYLACADPQSERDLMTTCRLPDTFQSWFLVTQLHVWMCLVRLKQEGKEGSIAYKQLVTLLWQDVEYRMSLTLDDVTVARESKRELHAMFYGLVFAYDEGLVGDDHVLAAALWRNLCHAKKNQATMADLAAVTSYVRREMEALDKVPTEKLLTHGEIKFGKLRRA